MLSSISPSRLVAPGAHVAQPMRPRHAVWMAAAMVLLWALWAAYFNTAQFGDNIEQFNWAQSLELGYHKHPPLPSWALGAVIRLFGPSIYWAYGLATLCLLGTFAFTWMIGRELLGERVAAAAVVLWGLNLSFSQRVQLYNHNTVLVLCMAATVWFAMRATRGRLAWWAATGIAAGCALLSKYQAAVPLAGLLLVLVAAGHLKRPAQWSGLGVALALMLAVIAPHALWVVQHDFSTLRYASEAIESSTPVQRLGFIVSFLANQIRLASPALLAIALCAGWARFGRSDAQAIPIAAEAPRADFKLWMTGLVWAGMVVLAVMALAFGASLRNHWGVQALQFFSLWLAARWDRRSPIDLRRLVWVALAVQALSLAIYATEHRDPDAVLTERRMDTMYPAKRLAHAAVAHWAESTECPLHYVAGTVFDAGLVSLYSGGEMEVFDTARATPWVRQADLLRQGALVVLDEHDAVPPGVTRIIPFDMVPGDRHGRPAKTIRLGVLMPQQVCD
jgi:hypothetical protein